MRRCQPRQSEKRRISDSGKKERRTDRRSEASRLAGRKDEGRLNEIAKHRTQRTKRKGERSIIMMAGRSKEGGQNPGQSGAVEARTKGVAVGRKAFFGAQLR